MAIIKKFSPFQNLSNFESFIKDTNPSSDYFRITELGDTFTGGKNAFLIEGSEYLKPSTDVKIEILDVESNPVYFEPGNGSPEYYEGVSKLISVHVYDDTPIGNAKITILGELKNYVDENGAVVPVPDEWRGVYNVKWEKNITINKNLNNETIVRFYKRPIVNISELVKPIFSKSILNVTKTGYLHGIPQVPINGDNLSNWRAGTLYKLILTSGSWDRDVDENQITITNPSHTAQVIEVLNDKEILIDRPYAVDDIVSEFTSGSYSITYTDFENETIGETSLTGSFAKIDISQLKTFVGDVARVKVFRKSRNAVGDFQFVQESKLESTELLRDITTTSDTELSYGRFDEYNLSNYWITSSNDHTTSIDSSILSQAIKVDYDTVIGGVQNLTTSESFDISKDVEYTLKFKTILDGDVGTGKSLRAYLSSSQFTQDFTTISGSAIYKTRQDESHNIIANDNVSAKLVFEIKGDDWYISNASLRNAQDTSFSPDEFTIIQDIPRKLPSETFDFRFEFYDINNNYIPVDVSSVGVFNGGNDFPTSTKLLTFESDRNAFRFSSGSVQNPLNQQIQFKVGKSNLTGSLTFVSQAFDVDGNYLDPSDYSQYPGKLTSVTPAGALVTINNFTGSRTDNSETPFVGSIVYTASLENQEEFETIYRLEDGDNAPQLIVTSNANQFIYEPTTLSPKPSGQNITIRAQRKNLATLITPITINSGSNKPQLNFLSTENGIDTYSISALTFSSSFASNNFDEVTYSFTGSDIFGNSQSDEITISKVINFDGVSLVLSNESTSFPARSTGVIIGDLTSGGGDVQMFIGDKQITHDDISGDGVRAKNTFDIKTVTGTNVTPISTSPTTNEYGISAFQSSEDSGLLSLNIEYLAGDNVTSQSFSKVVSYTKSKKAVPNVEVFVTPQAQTINANSVGSGSESPQTIEVKATEGGTDRFTSIGTLVYSGGLSGTVSTNTITFTDTADDMLSDTETITIPINFTDGEGTSGTKNIVATVSRVRVGTPNVEVFASPISQTINADSLGNGTSTPENIVVKALEGNTSRFDDIGTITTTNGITTTKSGDTITITSTASDMTSDTGVITIPINFTDGEGTTGTKTIEATVSRVRVGKPNVEVSVSPSAQTIEANSVGDGSTNPQSLTIRALEGGTNRFTSIDSVSYTNGLSGTISSNTITFTSNASDMTSDTATATITVEFTDSEGTVDTKDVVSTVSRVRVAQPNTNFSVTPAAQSIDADSTGTLQGSITNVRIDGFDGNTALTYNQGTLTSGQYKITNVTGVTVSDTTPSTSTINITGFSGNSATGTASIAFKDTEGTSGTTSIKFTLSKSKKAAPTAIISANPQAQTVDSNANFSTVGTPSNVTIIVNEGGSEYGYDTSGVISTNNFRITGVTNATNNNNGTITPTTPSDGSGTTSVVTIAYTNSEGTSFTGKTITVNVGVAVQGDDGQTGNDGKRTLNGRIFYSVSATTAPSIPTATSYTFSNNTFTGLTTNWSTSSPTFEAGNSNKYWVSTFQAVETTAGGGTAVPSFAYPTQAINFTGIVTFSGGGGEISDGTNVLQNIPSGSITNHIGGANTTTIDGGKIATGEITSTGYSTTNPDDGEYTLGGTIFNLNNGSLRSKNFYIDSNGDAFFRGSLSAATGSFAGDISAATGTFGGSVTIGSGDNVFKAGASGIQLGDATFGDAPFRVNMSGDAVMNSATIGPVSVTSTVFKVGTGTDFGNSNTQLYIDSNGQFSLGDKLTFDTSGNLSMNGAITIAAGSTSEVDFGAGAAASASAAQGAATAAANAASAAQGDATAAGNAASTAQGAATAAGNAASAAQGDATAAGNAASAAQGDATAAGNAASTAQGTADSANSKADAINATTSSLENPTSYAFGGNAFALATNTAAAGLNLTSEFLGYHDGNSFKSYMANNGDFFLGGTSGALTWDNSTSVLNVNRVTATSGTIGSWAIGSSQLEGGTVSGGSDGNNTTGGMIINSGGWISAKEFNISSSGIASFSTSAKIGTAPLSSVFDPSGTDLRIKKDTKVLDGSNTAAFSSIFSIDGTGFRFSSGTRFGTTTFSSVIDSVDSAFDSLDTNGYLSYSCVLPGTKIITERGEVNVEDTNKDDIIKVYNFFTETWEWSPIDEILVNKVKGWSHIKTKLGIELKCSNSHWLYHPSYPGHKIEADELGVGGQLYVYHDGELKPDIITSINTFDEVVTVYNYELERIHNYVSDGVLSHNAAKIGYETTLGHQYVKNISTNISQGDLVKLDSNNELIKVTSSKDTSVVGILWEKQVPLSIEGFESGSIYIWKTNVVGVSSSVLHEEYNNEASTSFQDSFGNYIPTNETGSKEIWKVASIGDSMDYNVSGSYFTLTGFKMCNQGGDVIPGDLLCSSDTPGYLMKQPSEWVVTGFDGDSNPIYEERQSHCSYTVAKCMISSSWDSNGKMENVYGYLYCG